MAKKRAAIIAPTASRPLSSFADLLRDRGVAVTPAAPAHGAPQPPSAPPDGSRYLSGGDKLVLRRERKGHGGKTVTVVDGLPLPASQLDRVAQQLRKALGCGARVDVGRVIVQGDLVDAVERWLRAHGARQIVRGN